MSSQPPPIPNVAASSSVATKKSFFTPLRIAIGGGILLLACIVMCGGGLAIIAYLSMSKTESVSTSEMETRTTTPETKTTRSPILGEWVHVETGGLTATFQKDMVVLGGKGVKTEMVPYTIDQATNTATFKTTEGMPFTAKLGEDHRLYIQKVGQSDVMVYAREYKGGWHNAGEVDFGRRTPGLEDLDKPRSSSSSVSSGSASSGSKSSGSASSGMYKWNPTLETYEQYRKRLNPTGNAGIDSMLKAGTYDPASAANLRRMSEALGEQQKRK